MGLNKAIENIVNQEKKQAFEKLFPADKIGEFMKLMSMDRENANAWVRYGERYRLRIERGLCPLRYKVIYKTEEGKIHAVITEKRFTPLLTIIKNDIKRLEK